MMDKQYPKYDMMKYVFIEDAITGEKKWLLMIYNSRDINEYYDFRIGINIYYGVKRHINDLISHTIQFINSEEDKKIQLYGLHTVEELKERQCLPLKEIYKIRLDAFINSSKEMCNYADKQYGEINILNEV